MARAVSGSSRREVVAGVVTGIAAVAGGPTTAQNSSADLAEGSPAAIAFAREGADVAFGYLPVEEPDAKEVVELIRAEGRKAVPLPGDIRSEAFCRQLVSDAVNGLGGLDVLVSNAAMQRAVPSLLDISTE
jgi:Enoyl-(Acyl carrier protein) reductase